MVTASDSSMTPITAIATENQKGNRMIVAMMAMPAVAPTSFDGGATSAGRT